MSIDIDRYGEQFVQDYYSGDFENVLTKYRKRFICKLLKKYKTESVLEIGCGMEPFFLSFNDFEKMMVIEPANRLFNHAKELSEGKKNIYIINDFIENCISELCDIYFDFILCVGLIHEVDDPELLISSVRKLSKENTYTLFTTNNPMSFHILLGLEMGVISDICGISEKAKLFQRNRLYTKSEVENMLNRKDFEIVDSGSYFVKPFTHGQMKAMQDCGILTDEMLDGFDKMIKYIPDLGAENYWLVRT